MSGRSVDANQKAENAKLRQMGYSVWVTSALGQGAPDAVVGKPDYNLLVEWKASEKHKLTPAEVTFHAIWKGPLLIAWTAEQVHAAMCAK